MADSPAITDRNLEATTNISLKREPACFAFLSARSVSSPMPVDSINLDLASADYFGGRASLWTTLEMRSSVSDDRPTALLGFDETFLRPFARALIEAATTRAAYRMTILQETRDTERCRVVEYVTGPGKALHELGAAVRQRRADHRDDAQGRRRDLVPAAADRQLSARVRQNGVRRRSGVARPLERPRAGRPPAQAGGGLSRGGAVGAAAPLPAKGLLLLGCSLDAYWCGGM